jgi:hypothetical protein
MFVYVCDVVWKSSGNVGEVGQRGVWVSGMVWYGWSDG